MCVGAFFCCLLAASVVYDVAILVFTKFKLNKKTCMEYSFAHVNLELNNSNEEMETRRRRTDTRPKGNRKRYMTFS